MRGAYSAAMANCMQPAARALCTVLLLALSGGAAAQPTNEAVLAVVNDFHAALKTGDRVAVQRLLAPDVVIFEAGHAELSFDVYAEEHLGADMDHAGATSRQILSQSVSRRGAAAWVVTEAHVTGTDEVHIGDSVMVETAVLEHDGRNWRIVHIHWSARAP